MTDKKNLELIREHGREYYANSREYKFIDSGFVSYELFNNGNGNACYIADIFVSKKDRGGDTFEELVRFCKNLIILNDVNTTYCRIEKSNIQNKSMKKMLIEEDFELFREDGIANYYRRIS